MKIIYLYTSLTTVGGADRVIVQKANYLADTMGYEVYMITDSQKGRPMFFPLSSNVKHIDIDIDFEQQYNHGLIIRSYYYFTRMHIYKKRINKLLRAIKPDIVITTLGREMDFLTRLKDGSIKIGESHIAKAFCRNFHLAEQRGFFYKLIVRYWRKKQENEIKKLDAFVVLTQYDADSWKNVKKAYIIPNSLPFYPQQSSSCKEKKIISIGRFTEQKGYERFIEAWAKVSPKHPDWEVSVYGEGVDQHMLESLIKEKAIENNFKLYRPVKNIQDKYLESSIYVMTSRFEGFGMVLAEAMACGVPCISFDCPHGPADIITNGEDGILVENGNIDKLAEAIYKLIENEELRIGMGQKAKANISRYSDKQVMKQWDELFKTFNASQR